MSEKITDFLIDPTRIHQNITSETRAFMSQMLEFTDTPLIAPTFLQKEKKYVQNLSSPLTQTPVPIQASSIIPSLVTIMGRILHGLESNLSKLLSLNPSRRDAIVLHLEKLAGSNNPSHQKRSLQDWLAGARSNVQNAALKTYLEEVALIALGQAILLKSWSDRGIRKWTEQDLGRLNWALSMALKPLIPLDREGWQITRPNLYSWFSLSPVLQHEVWVTLDTWKLSTEGPNFLMSLLGPLRCAQPETFEPAGLDPRFFKVLWDQMSQFGFDASPEIDLLKRNKTIFSPTLRDATMVRNGPSSVNWVGLEASSFQLMFSELMQIWWGPAPPPFWTIGTGLEVHTRDQLALALGSTKASVISKVAEMEACDIAIVLEEQIVRAQGRNANAGRFRELLEGLPYFKKLRSAGTSLGDLQACVSLSKLRPGGLLWWAREEALSSKDGTEVLGFILDRAKLCCEWDFSELEHSLPVSVPLYPKYLYLFQKEIHVETRLSHRPIRHSIVGQIRSHVELPLLLEDALASASQPIQARGQWTITSHPSPTPQREWIEKWPDPTSQSSIRHLDQLRLASHPLAQFTTIRPTPEGDPSRQGQWSIHFSLRGFWICSEYDSDGRKLTTHPLPRPGNESQGSGFLVLVSDETWISPLIAYLTSDLVRKWLDHNSERRGDRWILSEQVLKWIPVPKALLAALGVPSGDGNANQLTVSSPLPGPWERWANDVAHQPKAVKVALSELERDELGLQINASIFVRTARAFDYLTSGQNRLFSLVKPDGGIKWRDLLEILPKSECVSISIHSRIRLSGTLPPHLPIGRIEKVKSPSPGILLVTESGFNIHIGSDSTFLIHILWEQLDGIKHPTWNELIQYLKLPRKIELAESTAMDVLRSHSEQHAKLKDLKELLSSCQLF